MEPVFRYPYTSMVYSRFDARNFQRIPARAYDAQLLRVKVPSNYNPVCKTYGNSDAADDSTGQRTGARYNAGQAKVDGRGNNYQRNLLGW